MASNLLAITNISESPSKNPSKNNKFLSTFKLKIKQCFDLWWQGKRNSEGKLDFYFKYKKFFKYEEYLDFLPRHVRRFMTRLRTSSHNFPIEILRYGKNKPKREERKCKICTLYEKGDEIHYLIRCNNFILHEIRQSFLKEIKEQKPQLDVFSTDNIIQYCLPMTDRSIYLPMATYVKNILQAYGTEKREIPPAPVTTRSGRLVKKPNKLDL